MFNWCFNLLLTWFRKTEVSSAGELLTETQKHCPSFVWAALKQLLWPGLCSLDALVLQVTTHIYTPLKAGGLPCFHPGWWGWGPAGGVGAVSPWVVGSAQRDFWLFEKEVAALARQL